jgi:hypothetical protein
MSTAEPFPPKADNTALYVVLGVTGGVVLLCIAPALIIVVCLTAVQLLGRNSSALFQTVAMSISSTDVPGSARMTQLEAKFSADEFASLLLDAQYERAYARTTPEYRRTTSPQALRQMWDAVPLLRQRDDLSYSLEPSGWGTDTKQTFVVTWTDQDNQQTKMTVEVTCTAAGERQISRCSVP